MATTITKPETLVGKSIRRREDPRLITGTAIYVDDIKMPGMHHAAIVRSPHAAARIKRINTQAGARASRRGGRLHRRGCQGSRARPLRRVAARTARAAPPPAGAGSRVLRRAIPWPWWWPRTATWPPTRADLVEVEYEPLAAVADPEKALAAGAPAVHPAVAR